MKKRKAFLLSVLCPFVFPAPSGVPAPQRRVNKPLAKRPDYRLEEGAPAETMRETVVRAMRDMLTVPWFVNDSMDYEFRTYKGTFKPFSLSSEEIYAGVPYTNGISGIFQFFEYYDPATGRLRISDGETLDVAVGNQCAGAVIWALATVASSMSFHTIGLRWAEGVLPVGDYHLPTVDEEKSCRAICQANGAERMYEAYAKMRPADFVTSNDHVMMACEAPSLARGPDGAIDPEKSLLFVQDQRGGIKESPLLFVKEEDGESHRYAGRTRAEISFRTLFERDYIPLSCAELLGEKPYTPPGASADRPIASLEDLAAAKLCSRYNLAVFTARVLDTGAEIASRTFTTTYADMQARKLKNFPLADLGLTREAVSEWIPRKGRFLFVLSCRDATGTVFEVARFPLTAD